MTAETLPVRGWYDDPADPARERYWNGRGWTQRVRRKAEAIRRPHPVPVTPQVPGPAPLPAASPESAAPVAPVGAPGAPAVTNPASNVAPTTALAYPALSPVATVTSVPLASWGRRVGGCVIDYFIIAALVTLSLIVVPGLGDRLIEQSRTWISAALEASLAGSTDPVPLPAGLTSLMQQIVLLRAGLVLVYSIAFLGTWGATPGMRLVGLRVIPAPPAERVAATVPKTVSAEVASQPLPWNRTIWRSLAWVMLDTGLSIFAFLQIFSLLMPLWHPRRQTIHDLIGQTLVIHTRTPAQPRSEKAS